MRFAQYMLQKTEHPDVYNLLSVSTGKKVELAYIPDMETSKRCKQWFKDNKTKELLVKCQMNMDKKKWIPIELIEEDVEVENSDSSEETDEDESDSSDREVVEV